MTPLDFVLAAAALMAPPAGAEPAPAAPELAGLRRTVRAVALSWEVLDAREAGRVLSRPRGFDSDLDFLRRRYRDLADAPPLVDCLRFPARQVVDELLASNRACHRRLTQRLGVEAWQHDEITAALAEADDLYRVWDLLREAAGECYYVTARRSALRALREAVGPAAYYSGTLPPHVPVWRFAPGD